MKMTRQALLMMSLITTPLMATEKRSCAIGQVEFTKGKYEGCRGDVYGFDNITDKEVMCLVDINCEDLLEIVEIPKEILIKNSKYIKKTKN